MVLRRGLLLTFAVFGLEAVPFGAWLAMIPIVKEQLMLSKMDLALGLLGMPLGVLPTLQVAGWLVGRVGPRRMLMAAFPLQAVLLLLPLSAPSLPWLFGVMVVYGAVIAMFNVALNVYAGRLEKQAGVIVMNRCHGFWAAGVMAGSAPAALLPGLGPLLTVQVIAWPTALAGVYAAYSMVRLAGDDIGRFAQRRRWKELPPRLGLIALCALAASMTEGAMSDWSAVYLAERLEGDVARAGIAVSIFAGMLAAGRFAGDAANRTLGTVRLARLALGCAAAGLLLLVIPLPLWTSYAGFALVGLGVSVGFPLGVSAAAALDDTHEGPNIAIVSTVTMAGFLVGPPLIGALADAFSLRVGLAALLPGLIAGIALAGALVPGESRVGQVNRGDSAKN